MIIINHSFAFRFKLCERGCVHIYSIVHMCPHIAQPVCVDVNISNANYLALIANINNFGSGLAIVKSPMWVWLSVSAENVLPMYKMVEKKVLPECIKSVGWTLQYTFVDECALNILFHTRDVLHLHYTYILCANTCESAKQPSEFA